MVALETLKSLNIISTVVKDQLKLQNLTLSNCHLDPENIKLLPQFDCVLLLAVFHHWCKAYGQEKALEMLDVIYQKTSQVLFFETGENERSETEIKKSEEGAPKKYR